jgi:hydrogenase nickel incorporation protein HypB
MDTCRIIDLKKSILRDNDEDAKTLRKELKAEKTFYLNVMSSPGAGKTSTILKTLNRLRDEFRIGVMEADIDSTIDAKIIAKTGIPTIQLHTGGMCHLDADMSRQGIREFDSGKLDLVILENIGNLVCPAEFDTGACRNIVILSVPEGDDKPLKYPLMFEKCDVVLINKTDALPAFDFNLKQAETNILMRNPHAKIYPVSASTEDGFEPWCQWLKEEIRSWISESNDTRRPVWKK